MLSKANKWRCCLAQPQKAVHEGPKLTPKLASHKAMCDHAPPICLTLTKSTTTHLLGAHTKSKSCHGSLQSPKRKDERPGTPAVRPLRRTPCPPRKADRAPRASFRSSGAEPGRWAVWHITEPAAEKRMRTPSSPPFPGSPGWALPSARRLPGPALSGTEGASTPGPDFERLCREFAKLFECAEGCGLNSRPPSSPASGCCLHC